jgi:hypothetical protein
MGKKHHLFLAVFTIILSFLLFYSKAQATYLQAYAVGGSQLATDQNVLDIDYGYVEGGDDYVAHAIDENSSGDYADVISSITGSGVELKVLSYGLGNEHYASGDSLLRDNFTLTTMTGEKNAILDAAMNFNLTGTISDFDTAIDSSSNLHIFMVAKQNGSLVDMKTIDYDINYDAGTNSFTYGNSADWSDLFLIYPSISGSTFSFNTALNLYLDDIQADSEVYIELRLSADAKGAIADFSNTFSTDQSNPFEIMNNPSGNSYLLDTGSDEGYNLFGILDETTIGGNGPPAVPEPSTMILLGTGLLVLTGTRKRYKK